jgi:ferredoxin
MYIVMINTDICEACGECVDICATEAISLVEEDGRTYAMFTGELDDCLGCLSCEEVCEEGAITVTEM